MDNLVPHNLEVLGTRLQALSEKVNNLYKIVNNNLWTIKESQESLEKTIIALTDEVTAIRTGLRSLHARMDSK